VGFTIGSRGKVQGKTCEKRINNNNNYYYYNNGLRNWERRVTLTHPRGI
jgi:hypothetical protein